MTPSRVFPGGDCVTKSPSILLEELFLIHGIQLDPKCIDEACSKIVTAVKSTEKTSTDIVYDCFISYRVNANADVAEKIYFYLKSEGIHPFLDKKSLTNGEDWKIGFLRGLHSSKCMLSLVSSKALAPCRDRGRNHAHDNYLLELEMALNIRQATHNSLFLIPVLIGEYIQVPNMGNFLSKFSDYHSTLYADHVIPPEDITTKEYSFPDNYGTYTGQWKNHQWGSDSVPHGQGIRHYGSHSVHAGAMYEGHWQDGKRDGNGKMIFGGGDIYEGDWIQDKMQGKGKYSSIDGGVYDGNWMNNNKCGNGKIPWIDGDEYEGDWLDDKMHGKGKRKSCEGDVYVGDWVKDMMHGHGKHTSSDGDAYDGDWIENKKHGKGKILFVDGESYVGDWYDNKKHGIGNYFWADGNTYEGNWVEDKIHGKGKYTWADGDLFEGDWMNDMKHGKGKMITADGQVHEGEWENDERIHA